MALLNYTANPDEVLGDYSPLPVGQYLAVIVDADLCQNSSGTGDLIKIKFEVMDGEYKGRFLFANINFRHQNPKAEAIGRKELNTIMIAGGVPNINDTNQLIGLCMVVDVVIEENQQYGPKNKIKMYYPVNDGQPAPQSQPAHAPTAPAQAAPAAPQQQAVAQQAPAQQPAAPAQQAAPQQGGTETPPWRRF